MWCGKLLLTQDELLFDVYPTRSEVYHPLLTSTHYSEAKILCPIRGRWFERVSYDGNCDGVVPRQKRRILRVKVFFVDDVNIE